jgi:hypothetical protein
MHPPPVRLICLNKMCAHVEHSAEACVVQRGAPQGVEMDMIHLECILANLISRKFIKGYLHHQRKILVAHRSVEAAYPPIGQCVLGDPGGFTM